jgi:hypothetical protein
VLTFATTVVSCPVAERSTMAVQPPCQTMTAMPLSGSTVKSWCPPESPLRLFIVVIPSIDTLRISPPVF